MLILPIKKKWYDMILSGEKKEEYREIKPYYRSRLYHEGFLDRYGLPQIHEGWVLFRNGYSKNSPSFEALCTVDIRTGRPEWGAEPGQEYYVLKVVQIKLKDFHSEQCWNYDECSQCEHKYECASSECIAEIEPMTFIRSR